MKEKMFFRKTCSLCASDIHFATIIIPFIRNEIVKKTTIKTMLERDETKNIEKVIQNMGLNSEIKNRIKEVDWKKTNIENIRRIFKELEKDIKDKKDIDIIIQGSNIFIEKINNAIDLWVKNNIKEIENKMIKINVINNFLYEENKEIYGILDKHEFILKTSGIEENLEEKFEKAN